MIPRPDLVRLRERMAFVSGSSIDEPPNAGPDWDRLITDRLAILGGDEAAERLTQWLASTGSNRRRASIQRLIDLLFGPLGALASRRNGSAEALLRLVISSIDGDPAVGSLREALTARMRAIQVYRFGSEVTELVSQYRELSVSTSDTSLPARMRIGARLNEFYRTITGPSPEESIVATARAVVGLPLRHESLRIVLGHFVPLLRPRYSPNVAGVILDNLDGWIGQLRGLRSDYVRRFREESQLPDVGDSSLPETEEDLYTLALNAALTHVVHARVRDEPAELANVVYIEKALNEVGMPLVRNAANRWEREPDVLCRILGLAGSIRSLRLQITPLLDQLLFDRKWPATVQVAAIRLAAAFTGSFSPDEARLARTTLLVDRGDGDYRELEDDMRSAYESDRAVRERLERVAGDAKRPVSVRGEAITTLLRSVTDAAEQQRIFDLAAGGEAALVEPFLRHVIAEAVHSAFDHLVRIEARKDLKAPLRSLLAEAFAATGHVRGAQWLRNREESDVAPAVVDTLLEKMGARGVLDELHAQRTIRHNIAASNAASAQREEASRKETDSLLNAVRESSAAVQERLAAERCVSDRQFVIALAAADETRLVIRLEQHYRELLELQARLHPIQVKLDQLRQSLSELANQHGKLQGNINRCVETVHEKERDIAGARESINDLTGSINASNHAIAAAESRISQLESDIEHAEYRLRNVRDDDPDAPRRIHGEISHLKDQIRRTGDSIEVERERITSFNRQIARHRSDIRDWEAERDRIEDQVAELRDAITRNRQHAGKLHATHQRYEEDLDELIRAINIVRGQMVQTQQETEGVVNNCRQRVQALEAQRREHAEREAAHRHEADRSLREADRQRQLKATLNAQIVAIEQRTAELLQSVIANRDTAAQELATISESAAASEDVRINRRRIRQAVQLNIDLLMIIAKRLIGPGPEASHVLARMEHS